MKTPSKKEVRQALDVVYKSVMLEKGAQEFAAHHPGANIRIHADVVLEVVGSDTCVTVREFDGYELQGVKEL